jgi:CheY-like chemotaxis protein
MNAQDERGPGKRVLIVEDSVDTAQMMKVLLKGEGYRAQTAYDGGEALEVARSFRLEVVLLDLTLPGMTGHEVAAELRKDEATAMSLFSRTSFCRTAGRSGPRSGIGCGIGSPTLSRK